MQTSILNISSLFGAILSLIFLTGCSGIIGGDQMSGKGSRQLDINLDSFPMEEVNEFEEASLIFMREEEKLARDVYITMYSKWGYNIFNNISSSEQQHTDGVKLLLDRYGITDPVSSDAIGDFTNSELWDLYQTLKTDGDSSLVHALSVGALIEEIDIRDLDLKYNENIDNQDIIYVYQILMDGSHNHLRAFVRTLSDQGITYVPQVLSEEEYLSIIN